MRWTHEKVAEKAKGFTKKKDFRKAYDSAYMYAYNNKILDEVCAHMPKLHTVWTYEKVATIAKKYNTKSAFQKGDRAANAWARRNGHLESICSHMGMNHTKAQKAIDTYTSTNELKRKDLKAYNYAVLNGMDISHLDPTHKYTIEECTSVALSYNHKIDFLNNCIGMYKYAARHGVLDEICSHMTTPESATTDADMVYLWRIPNTNICKIGLSSVRLGDTRIKDVANAMEVDYEILTMCHVTNAREIEKELHSTYQILPTTLPKADGYTEFRVLSQANIHHIVDYLENIVGDVL